MILIAHIIFALASLVFTGAALVKPTKNKFTTSVILVVSTLVSGTVLVLSKPATLTQVCVEGVVYLLIVGVGLSFVKNRIVKLS